MKHNLKQLASLVDYLNRRERFTCFLEGTEHYRELQTTFGQINSFLNSVSSTLKGSKNEVDRKDTIANLIKPEGPNALTIEKAKTLYQHRSLWLPFEHMQICSDIIKNNIKEKNIKRRFLSPEEYVIKHLQIDYNSLTDIQKNDFQYGSWYALLEDALNDKGVKRLKDEYERYIGAINPVPQSMIDQYKDHITITDNPIDFILDVLGLYSSNYVITQSTEGAKDYDILDI